MFNETALTAALRVFMTGKTSNFPRLCWGTQRTFW